MLVAAAILLAGCSVASLSSPDVEPRANATELEPTPNPEAPPCQALPRTVTEVLEVPRPFRVGCLSGVLISIRARLIECRCDVDGASFIPAWLDGGSQPLLLVEPDATGAPAEYDDWLILRLDPDGESPDVLPIGELVEVAGIFDHPASRACTISPMPGAVMPEEQGTPSPTDACRYFFATTSLAGGSRPTDPSPSPSEAPTAEPSATPDATPTPSPTASPAPTPAPSPAASQTPTPTATPWPMAVTFGEGVSNGLPFKFTVWVDHEGGGHGTFAGRVPSGADSVAVDGPVSCARIEGAHGVFGWQGAEQQLAFTVSVSDDPDGMVIVMGRSDCVLAGVDDPASHPISEGSIEVIPEPPH